MLDSSLAFTATVNLFQYVIQMNLLLIELQLQAHPLELS